MSLKSIIQNAEAFETKIANAAGALDPTLKAEIDNFTAQVKAEAKTIADGLAAHADAAAAAVDAAVGTPAS
jgi:hypothetical protein